MTMLDDLYGALRRIWRERSQTAIVVVTIAVAIGASCGMFTVVNALLLKGLPFPDSDRVVFVWDNLIGLDMRERLVSAPEFRDYRERVKTFEHLAAYQPWDPDLSDVNEPIWLTGAAVTPEFFSVVGVFPAVGRGFFAEDAVAGSDRIVILSHRLARRLFADNPRVIGQTVTLGGANHIVVGVMPEDFAFPRKAEIWKPLAFSPEDSSRRGFRAFFVIGRLRPDRTLTEAGAEMSSIAASFGQEHPDNYPAHFGFAITVQGVSEHYVVGSRGALFVLSAAVACLLLIACANAANLRLANAVDRTLETAVRSALGSTRARIFRQLLYESLLLFGIGGALGLVLAYWGVDLLVRLSPEGSIPLTEQISLDGRVVAFALAVSMVCGVVSGVTPAVFTSRTDVNDTLKRGGRGVSQHRWASLAHDLFVTAQLALALILLVGAGLLAKSFYTLLDVDAGLRSEGVVTAPVSLVPHRYREPHRQLAFFGEALEKIQAVPGVRDAALVTSLPFAHHSGNDWSITVEGAPIPAGALRSNAQVNTISPRYFHTFSIPVRQGRVFADSDGELSERVTIVNQKLAALYWPTVNPLGRRLKLGGPDSKRPWMTVVGVVGDVRQAGPEQEPKPEVFVPFAQNPTKTSTLVARGSGEGLALARLIRDRISTIDPDQPLGEIQTMDNLVPRSVLRKRFELVMLTLFAALALLLSTVGIYSVTSHSVKRRTRDIGTRVALGAERRDIFALVLQRALKIALIGTAIGLFGAAALTQFMRSLLFGTEVFDPAVIGAVAVFLVLVTLVASYLPARRAAHMAPTTALRYE